MLEKFISRDTVVVEWQYPEEVGSDEAGYQKTVKFIDDLFVCLGIPTLNQPGARPHAYVPKDVQQSLGSAMSQAKAHLCGKYGYAGFGSGNEGVYGHLYLWDRHSEEYEDQPSFGTMDVSFPSSLSNQIMPECVINEVRKFFKTDQLTWKATNAPEQMKNFVDFAPHILRQRLLIQGVLSGKINQEQVAQCMGKLCALLQMGKLSEPEVYETFAFMHWEDSGTVASWTKEIFNIDIYTCKGFEVQKAVDLIQQNIQQEICKIQSI